MDHNTRKSLVKNRQGNNTTLRTSETFANGNLEGEWVELGSDNQAGNLRNVEFDKDANKLYGIAGGGILYSGNLDGTGWTPLNETNEFRGGFLEVVENGAGTKIIVAIQDKDLYYSSNNGLTWTASAMDFNAVDNWGEPAELVALDDGTIYYLRRAWDSVPWAPRMWLYRSTDFGANFTRIAIFNPVGSEWVNSNHSKLWAPLGSNTVFLLHQGKELYTINGATVSLRNSNTVLTQEVWLDLEGNINGTDTTLYALMEKSDIYKSTNLGGTWTLQGTTPEDAWNVGFSVSPFDADVMYMGAVEAFRSYDGGVNWTKVNTWGSYYSDYDKIHADIMDIKSYEKSDGTEFVLIANHGGLHASYDELQTTTNLGQSGLNIGQFYDVRTDPLNPSYVYGGTQDQGHQRTSTASGASSPVDFDQVISGDYGHIAFSRNNQSLWTVYPGGWTTYYHNPQTNGYQSSFDLEGNHPPVADWIFPTSETVDPNDNSIYIAGGDINDGDGSHLVTLTAQTSSPHTITATQFSYDFRANSNSGTSTISAIEPSTIDTDRLYVATDDGTFFYSNNGGASWNKTSSFSGPGEYWLYGSTILASNNTSNLVWLGGSGYSNDPVWKSTDGGATFSSMSNGLPSSLIHELVASTDETLIFAATDVGPYVYVVADDMWYPMLGNTAPIQRYYSVEYVAVDNLVRFGTYGRGIWDFKIALQPLPVELISFEAKLIDNQSVRLDWATASEIDNDFFEIQKSVDGINFEAIGKVNSQGDGNSQQAYQAYDERPSQGTNYYRLKQVDFDGKFEYSNIRVVTLDEVAQVSFYPNPIQRGNFITIENDDVNVLLEIFDANGRLIKEKRFENDTQISTDEMGSGTYFYRMQNSKNGQLIKDGKLIVL